MRRTNLLIGLWLGLALFGGAAEEAKAPTSTEIEASAEFAKAPLTSLEPVVDLGYVAPKMEPLADDVIAAGEVKMRAFAERFGIPVTQEFQWYPYSSGTSVYHRDPEGGDFSLWFDRTGRDLKSIRVFGLPILDELKSRVTSELFEEYASSFYLRAFGESPTGSVSFQWDGEGIRRFGKESAIWSVLVDGVMMNRGAGFSVDRDVNHKMTVFCSKGPTRREIEEMKALLTKSPVRITAAEASAIAWKNWKAVRPDGFEDKEFSVHGYLREVTTKELEDWSAGRSKAAERQAWSQPEFDAQKSDLVYYDIKIGDGLFVVDVLVDRGTGAVVRMHQGRMSW